jgi:hypothetical protein
MRSQIFGDAVAVAAMVDRLVHHAEVIVLKGESYRLKGKGKEVMGSESTRARTRSFQPAITAQFSTGVDKEVDRSNTESRSL